MRFDRNDRADTSQIDDRRAGGGAGKAALGGVSLLGVVAVVIFKLLAGDQAGAVATIAEAAKGAQGESAPGPKSDRPPPSSLEGSCEGASSQVDSEKFNACVQANVQAFWQRSLKERAYQPAQMVLFRDETKSPCGEADTASGPFYCPADSKVYLDTAFFKDLQTKLRAKGGDFAEAYVIAHEYGHHVQNLLGTNRKVRALQAKASKVESNALSVKMELQADCYAGAWGHDAFAGGKVDKSEIAIALDAAAAVGDDHIQKLSRGKVQPETFTHGSSAERQRWFLVGFESGDYQRCDTFN